MSDNLRRYCDILAALKRLCRQEPTGNHARHLKTLALLISGIVGSKKCQLPAISTKSVHPSLRESRIKRLTRFLQNERITAEVYFLPYVKALLHSLPEGPLVLVMDGSGVGRGCIALVVSVLYKKRALPLGWIVVAGEKGHLPDQTHQQLVEIIAARLPEGREIIFLGDGEFDGIGLLSAVTKQGWQFVCRTQKNTVLWEGAEDFRLSWLNLEAGEVLPLENVFFTQEGFGPLLCVACWDKRYKEPLYLVSNLELWQEALYWYKKRFQIETFFSDQKSRGFGLAKSHLSDPARLCRLLMATCLAYIWIVCLGVQAVVSGKLPLLHRRHRCDLSLFQIGLLWLEHCLNEALPIPVEFRLPQIRGSSKSVR
jgi:Transposase DDE domain